MTNTTNSQPTSTAAPSIPRLRLHMLWIAAGWVLIFGLIYGSLAHIHLPVSPRTEFFQFLLDKGKHFLAYFLIMLIFAATYHRNRWGQTGYLAGLALLGYVLEILQGMTGYRSFDYGDLNANLWGIAFAFALINFARINPLGYLEKKILPTAISS